MAEPYLIEGRTGPFEVVLGLEVHAQVVSRSKLFSGASTTFGGEPNSQVSLVDAAMPGMLPVLNGECVRQAVRTGLALGAQINKWSRFDRKNYFYADLPQGYQISQFQHPVVGEGALASGLGRLGHRAASTSGRRGAQAAPAHARSASTPPAAALRRGSIAG